MRTLSAHPVWAAAGAAVVVVVLALTWYLGSPLFIRTTVQEAFPTVAPVVSSVVDVVATGAAPSGAATAGVPATPRTIGTGTFGYVDAQHNGTGTVLLLATGNDAVLRFENVAITNAPDVHVYLSREIGGKWTEGTSLYLGPLKATNGSFNYAVPKGTDLAPYKSVVVWCRQFAVLVTWADLR